MSNSPARVVAIGLDAMSPVLLERWMNDGSLPNLQSLFRRSLTGTVHGLEGFYVGSTWASMYTGRSPANHGMHYELQLVPGTYDLARAEDADFVQGENLWAALSRQGRRIAVLDVPLCRPTANINGVEVIDWGGHDIFFGFQSSPPELAEEIVARHGRHPQTRSCDMRYEGVDDYRQFLERMEAGIPTKVAWTRELLERGGWDLLVQVFTEPHCAGHQTWHLHDPAHPAHDAAIVAEIGDPMLRAYKALDAAVGDLVAAAGDARVLVWSGHGMSYWRGAQFLLSDILVKLGVTHLPPAPADGGGKSGLRRMARAVWRHLPGFAQAPVRKMRARKLAERKRIGAPRTTPKLKIDCEKSLCFPVNNGMSVGGIRLNLSGREPNGRLRPGAETDAFIAELTADLLAVIDERTGRPAIQRVVRSGDLYEGEHLHRLPDLLVEWADDVPTGSTIVGDGAGATVRLSSPKIGSVEGANIFGRTGGHRNKGWFMLAGPGIEAGRLDEGVSLMDLAPTIAAMVGAEMPEADGRVVPEFLASALPSSIGSS